MAIERPKAERNESRVVTSDETHHSPLVSTLFSFLNRTGAGLLARAMDPGRFRPGETKMRTLGLLLCAVTLLATVVPAPAAARDVPDAALPTYYVVIEGIAAMKVPSSLATWAVSPTDDAGYQSKVTVFNADGSVYGALRLHEELVPPITLIETTAPLGVPELAAGGGITIQSNCTTTIHGYSLCADVSYAGGSGAVWNSGSTSGQSGSYYCYNCLTIQGCYEALFTFCDRQVLFTVSGSSTAAAVCWTWGAWRDVWTKAIYDGASVTSNRVWITATTSC